MSPKPIIDSGPVILRTRQIVEATERQMARAQESIERSGSILVQSQLGMRVYRTRAPQPPPLPQALDAYRLATPQGLLSVRLPIHVAMPPARIQRY